MNLAARLKGIRRDLGQTQEEFATTIGVSRAVVAQYETNKSTPPRATLEKIAKAAKIEVDDLVNNVNTIAEPHVHYYKNTESKPIPFYDVNVTAGNVDIFNDTKEKVSSLILFPEFAECDFAVPVYGHSMYPKICSGNIIFCKRIEYLDFIEYGQIYLIVTKDDRRMVKVIRKSQDKEKLLLISENEARFDPVEISRELVKDLYLVKGWANKNEM